MNIEWKEKIGIVFVAKQLRVILTDRLCAKQMLEKNIDQVLLANKLCILSVNVPILVGNEMETNFRSIVESKTACNRAKWVLLDLE